MLLNICMPQFLHWAFPHLFPTHCKIARPLSLCPGDKKCGHTWVCRDTNSLSKDSRGLLLIEDSFFASHSPERKSLAELPVSLVCVWTPGVEKCKCGGGVVGGDVQCTARSTYVGLLFSSKSPPVHSSFKRGLEAPGRRVVPRPWGRQMRL